MKIFLTMKAVRNFDSLQSSRSKKEINHIEDAMSDSVLISALQKFIRRCDVNGALYTAQQLISSKREHSESFSACYQRWHRLWRRLIVIASEDIGIAQKGVLKYLQEQLVKINTNEDLWLELTLNAVMTLACAKKSRLTDHAIIYYGQKITSNDEVTKHLDLYEILDEKPINEQELLHYISRIYIKDRKMIPSCWQAISTICTDTEEFDSIYSAWKDNECILFLLHAGLLITRNYPSEQIIEQDIKNLTVFPVSIPDYVYDMHTSEGRKLGRDFKHFIEVSCQITNQPTDLYDQYYDMLLKKS